MTPLDQWEAEAKESDAYNTSESQIRFRDARILALIDLVRKKDIELGDIAMSDCSEYVKSIADKALQLTESLK